MREGPAATGKYRVAVQGKGERPTLVGRKNSGWWSAKRRPVSSKKRLVERILRRNARKCDRECLKIMRKGTTGA